LKSLKIKTIENIGYQAVARCITFGLQAVTGVVLAQQLSPSDFGIINFAMIFVSFIARFNELGIGSAVIQRKYLEEKTVDIAFTLRLLLGVLAFFAAVVSSKFASLSFGDEAVAGVIQVLSLNFLVGSLGFIPNLLLIRSLDYRRWIIPNVASAMVRTGAACALAIYGFGFWSLVIAEVATAVTNSVGLIILEPRAVRFSWDWPKAKELLNFGLPLFLSGFVIFILFNADSFIIGAVAGPAALGFYALAFSWGAMISTLVGEVVHSVLFPTLARLQDDVENLSLSYKKVMEQLSVFGILGYVGLFCCAEWFLVLVLGRGSDKWLPAGNALKILCAYGAVRLMLEPVGNVLVSLGKTRLILKANVIAAATEIALVYPALMFAGIEGVAWVVTIAYTIQWIVYWPVINKELHIGFFDLGRILLPSLLAGLAAGLVGISAISFLPAGFLSLFASAVVISLVFIFLQGSMSSWQWAKEWHRLILQRTNSA
jgi:O-antigen/teichoic acid export membrane protein